MPLVSTADVAALARVMLLAVETAVLALPQLVVAQEAPGVAGLLPPVGSTEA